MSETTETRQSAPASTNCLQQIYSAVSCLVDLVDYLAHKQSNQYEWLASQERRQLCRVHEEMEKLGTALKSTCEQALGTQPRQWRDGDVVSLERGTPIMRLSCLDPEYPWRRMSAMFDSPGYADADLCLPPARYCFNLLDLPAQGPIVVGLTEEEASDVLCGLAIGPKRDTIENTNAAGRKLSKALASYRRQEARV